MRARNGRPKNATETKVAARADKIKTKVRSCFARVPLVPNQHANLKLYFVPGKAPDEAQEFRGI